MIEAYYSFIMIPYLSVVFGQAGLNISKQRRFRSEATERGVRSESTLFATRPVLFRDIFRK